MKKRTMKTTDALDRDVDFGRFGPVRRNAFAAAGAGQRGGPSLLALWEMSELASDAVLLRRGHPGKGEGASSQSRRQRTVTAAIICMSRTIVPWSSA